MNKKNMYLFITIMTLLPAMTHGMLVTRIKPALRATAQKKTIRRSYDTGAAQELRKLIARPDFRTTDTHKIIKKTLPKDPKSCDVNGLIEDIVFKATAYKQHEVDYTNVLHQLHLHGWSVSGTCCINAMLHETVKSDLHRIATELLQQKKELVNNTDMDGRIPLHHAQSKEMATLLIKHGSPIDATDEQKNTPLHCVPFNVVPVLLAHGANIHAKNDIYLRTLQNGWQQLTPLRKAADEGDIQKCAALLANDKIDSKEREIVQSIAALHYWRTKDIKFFMIYQMAEIIESQEIIKQATAKKE